MSYMWRSRYNFWLLPNMVDVGLLVQAWKDLEISVQAPIQCPSFMGKVNLCCKVGTFRFAWHDVTEVKEVKEVKPEQRDELLQKNLPVTLAHLTCID